MAAAHQVQIALTDASGNTLPPIPVSGAPNAGQIWECGCRARYFRVVYTNGASDQTAFVLNTYLTVMPMQPDMVDMSVGMNANSHGLITHSLMAANLGAVPTTVVMGHGTAASALRVELPTNGTGQVFIAGGTPYNTAANTAGHAVSSAAGAFIGLTVNTVGVTSTATFYDGTDNTGTKLATVATTAQVSLTYNIALTTGLFVVLAGATPADVTVVYR